MIRWLGWLVGAVWIGTWFALVEGRDWYASFAQSTEAVVSCSMIVWPLSAGLGVAAGTALRKNGTLARLASWPGTPTLQLAMRDVGTLWLRILAGALVAFVVAGSVAWYLGSPPTAVALPGLLLALLGVANALLWGWILGAAVPSYVVSALAAVACYLVLWLLPWYTPFDVVAFTGTTMLMGTASELSIAGIAWFLAWQLGTLAAGLLLIRLIGISTWEEQPAVRKAGLATGAAAIVGATAFVFGPTGLGEGAWVDSGPHAWMCEEIAENSTACMPKDMRSARTDFFDGMRRVDAALRPFLPLDASILYGTSEAAVTGKPDFVVPLEPSFSEGSELWVGTVVAFIHELPPDNDEDACAHHVSDLLLAWERYLKDGGAPPSVETMHTVRDC